MSTVLPWEGTGKPGGCSCPETEQARPEIALALHLGRQLAKRVEDPTPTGLPRSHQ